MDTDEEVIENTEGLQGEADDAALAAEVRSTPPSEAGGDGGGPMPAQLGHKRFVYAAYLAGGIVIAFVVNKVIGYGWYKLHDWKPERLGEPVDEVSVPASAAIAVMVTLYFWFRTRARVLAEEVAEELTKVTWPSRQEVQKSTSVVVLTTLFATVFFALMDQFWLWVTKHVYGS